MTKPKYKFVKRTYGGIFFGDMYIFEQDINTKLYGVIVVHIPVRSFWNGVKR
jgi:hypothetical protein